MRRAHGCLLLGSALFACGGSTAAPTGDGGSDVSVPRDTGIKPSPHDTGIDSPVRPERDAGVDAARDTGIDATRDAADAHVLMTDAHDAAPPTPVGSTLSVGRRFLVEGVTDNGYVIYATPSSINAVPALGGTPTVLGAFGFDDAGVIGNGAVVVLHDLVLLWTDVTQFEASALPVGTLSVWSPATSASSAPTVLSTSAIAPSPYGGVVVAASADGSSLAYMVANTASGEIASLVAASTASLATHVTLDPSIGANPTGLCGPALNFAGGFLIARYCDVVSGDEGAPALFAYDTQAWRKKPLVQGVLASSVDGTGAYAAAVTVSGQLDLVSTSSDSGAAVAVDPSVTLSSAESIFLGVSDQFILYTTPAGALKASSVTGAPALTTLVASKVNAIDGVSLDAKWVYVNDGTDPNTGYPSDLSLASTSAAGAARQLASNTVATTLGDGFTADSSYALFATGLGINPMTGAFSGGTLNAAKVSASTSPAVVTTNGGVQVNALTGTAILFADHYNASGGLAGSADLRTVDVATTVASSLVIAGADISYALTKDRSKLVYTLNFGDSTDGLYIVSLP